MNRSFTRTLFLSFLLVVSAPLPSASADILERIAQFCRETFYPQATLDVLERREQLKQRFANPDGTYRPNLTLKKILTANFPLDDVTLKALGVPKGGWPFIDRKTGDFNYRSKSPKKLATENGDAPLDFIRIGYGANDRSRQVLDDYLKALQAIPNLTLVISHHAETYFQIMKKIRRAPEEVQRRIYLDKQWFLTPIIWTQDSGKPLDQNGILIPRTMIELRRIPHPITLGPAMRAAKKFNLTTEKSIFAFDGGHLVVGDRHVLISPSVIDRVQQEFFITREEARQSLREEFGREILEIGYPNGNSLKNVAFHQDVMIAIARDRKSPAREEVVLMTSMKRALEVLSNHTLTDFSLDGLDKYKKDLAIQLREFTEAINHSREGLLLNQLNYFGPSTILSTIEREAEVEKLLKSNGYSIRLIPGFQKITHSDNEPEFYSYANSIFSDGYAIIGKLGISKLDEDADSTIRSLGYKTIKMPSSYTLAHCMGGIRCASETHRR